MAQICGGDGGDAGDVGYDGDGGYGHWGGGGGERKTGFQSGCAIQRRAVQGLASVLAGSCHASQGGRNCRKGGAVVLGDGNGMASVLGCQIDAKPGLDVEWRCVSAGSHPLRVAFENGPEHAADELFHLCRAKTCLLGKHVCFSHEFLEPDNEDVAATVTIVSFISIRLADPISFSTYPEILSRLDLDTSSPMLMICRPITPTTKGVSFSITAAGPAMEKMSWPEAATGLAPKTGEATNVAPFSPSRFAHFVLVSGWTVEVSTQILPAREAELARAWLTRSSRTWSLEIFYHAIRMRVSREKKGEWRIDSPW
ncbi:hypothetical protein CMQ_3440 [Grosmannia clavigera kw1407]|uniref:Uncharacterized protein n=1 Tax=Grosmannia clavigera (strain kw1407 / UAMH 11150) TaxID=655863 RepID=F0X9R8_GROCL|nr:uncharacterized protein CMQ_3440 [Grosmannia clavigera kw1407]EFX05371.1 hypothetical protein CMQ_3440 [Grosmannia clavigera kw1407]